MKRLEVNFIPILRRLLRPAVRFCLRRSVKIQDLIRALKFEFVHVAKEELARESHVSSVSRLSAMTGLQRKDLKQLLDDGSSSKNLEGSSGNLMFRVINRWSQDRRFIKGNGKPRALTTEGLESEFSKLVRTVSTDLNHHTLLFELERLGFIRRDGNYVHLLTNVYSNQNNTIEALADSTQDLDDLYRAVEENLGSDGSDLNLHARTAYDSISSVDIPRIRKWIFEKGVEFHKQVRAYLAQFDRDLSQPGKSSGDDRSRIVFGTFSFSEKCDKSEEEREDDEK